MGMYVCGQISHELDHTKFARSPIHKTSQLEMF